MGGSLAGREAPVALGAIAPEELAAALAALVAPAGPPVVVGECFGEVSPLGCAALLEVLAETSHRRQVIIVTEHEGVGTWAESLGLGGVVWTPAEAELARRSLLADPSAVAVERPPAADTPPPGDLLGLDDTARHPDRTERGRSRWRAPEPRLRRGPPVVAEPIPPADTSKTKRRSRRARRKQRGSSVPAPEAQPWESRFDTSRRRSLPNARDRQTTPPEESEPLALCARHRGVLTRNHCARCSQPACDECLVTPRGRRKAICVECAIRESGVRMRRTSGG